MYGTRLLAITLLSQLLSRRQWMGDGLPINLSCDRSGRGYDRTRNTLNVGLLSGWLLALVTFLSTVA